MDAALTWLGIALAMLSLAVGICGLVLFVMGATWTPARRMLAATEDKPEEEYRVWDAFKDAFKIVFSKSSRYTVGQRRQASGLLLMLLAGAFMLGAVGSLATAAAGAGANSGDPPATTTPTSAPETPTTESGG